MLLRDVVCQYLEWKKPPRVTVRTYETYAYWLNRWVQWREENCLHPDINSLDQDELQAFFEAHSNMAAQTLKAWWMNIRALCRWSDYEQYSNGLMDIFNRYSGLAMPKPTPRMRLWYANDDFEKIIAACEDVRQQAIIWTLWDTGVRARELCSLNCADVVWSERVAQVHGKGGRYRWIFWSQRGWMVLLSYLGQRRHGSLFQSVDGEELTYNALQRIVRRIVRRSGVVQPPSAIIHGFRHSFAQSAIDAGISDLELQQLMGHSSVLSTQTYTRRPRNKLGSAHKKMRGE